MKKLNRLQIKSEKLMKNEELLKLHGGAGEICFLCVCPGGCPSKYELAPSLEAALSYGTEWCNGDQLYQHCTVVADTTWCGS